VIPPAAFTLAADKYEATIVLTVAKTAKAGLRQDVIFGGVMRAGKTQVICKHAHRHAPALLPIRSSFSCAARHGRAGRWRHPGHARASSPYPREPAS
jgi:hypothetical protein